VTMRVWRAQVESNRQRSSEKLSFIFKL
jgi:hypothetical protein